MRHETVVPIVVPLTEEILARYIIDATLAVFNTTLKLEPYDDYPLSSSVHHFLCNITGIVGFAGAYSGAITLHCPNALAFKMTSIMTGTACNRVTGELESAIGNVASMLAEFAKNAMFKGGHEVKFSIPSVITGESYTISSFSKNNRTFIPFFVDEYKFLVGVAIAAD